MIGSVQNHNTIAYIRTDPTPCLTVGRRQPRSYACTGVLQTSTCPVEGENAKDNSSDYITFFHLSIDQSCQCDTPKNRQAATYVLVGNMRPTGRVLDTPDLRQRTSRKDLKSGCFDHTSSS
ncbi:hypothetical protein TNCV_3242251 [Trichonephila clavipes]|nr:hypothetical protein TNCV_3242251 [Trichonephila clavipes]